MQSRTFVAISTELWKPNVLSVPQTSLSLVFGREKMCIRDSSFVIERLDQRKPLLPWDDPFDLG